MPWAGRGPRLYTQETNQKLDTLFKKEMKK